MTKEEFNSLKAGEKVRAKRSGVTRTVVERQGCATILSAILGGTEVVFYRSSCETYEKV